MADRPLRIVVIVGERTETFTGMILGVAEFSQRRPEWAVWRPRIREASDLDQRFPDGVDGAVGAMIGRGAAECLRMLADHGVPVVNVVQGAAGPGVHTVAADNKRVGRLVAGHFIDRGFRQFAYIGDERGVDDAARRAGFDEALRATGHRAQFAFGGDVYRLADRDAAVDRLVHWLGTVPTPIGIMAFNDHVGRAVVDAAHQAGLSVPDDVAVIGVDNYEVECELSRPRLASVDLGHARIGFQAAQRLDQLIRGERVPDEPLLLPPQGIVERPSCDVIAVPDALVSRAIRIIRSEVGDRLRVDDVLSRVNVSRTWLDAEFRKYLGRTVHEEIWARRVDLALGLLVDTDLPLTIIADRAGFSSLAHLSRTIRNRTGLAPSTYRRRYRVSMQ